MKILLLSPIFPPEFYTATAMMEEMARELVARGHEVTVFTAVPSRPKGETWVGYGGYLYKRIIQDGYVLMRIRSWQLGPKRTKINRVMENMVFGLISGCYLLFSQRYDKVISIPWPNICAAMQVCAAKIRKLSYYYFVMDLLPEQAESAGMMSRGSFAYRLLLWLDKVACRYSTGIFTLSEGLKKHIAESREVAENKILLTTIQVNSSLMQPTNMNLFWKDQFFIPNDTFLILFSGTLGFVSGIDVLEGVVPAIPDDSDILFLIIGEGPLAQSVKNLAERYPMRVRYLPFQPTEMFHAILHSVDVTLVTMNPQSGVGSVPSKMYTYMAAGKPILAAVPADSEVDRLVNLLGCGCVAHVQDKEAILQAVSALVHQRDRLSTIGAKGKKYVDQYCNVKNNANVIEDYWKRGNIAVEKDI